MNGSIIYPDGETPAGKKMNNIYPDGETPTGKGKNNKRKTSTDMKQFTALLCFLFCGFLSFSQNVGIGTTAPDNSAQLDIVSTSKGLLVPRLTTAQRTGIGTPAKGLLVFDTDTNGFWFYNGTVWINMQTLTNAWSLVGNAGTDSLINFVGTTDNKPLVFRINNTPAGFVGNNGNVFLGKGSATGSSTAFSNIAIGKDALKNNTDRSNLVAIGDSALYNNVTGATQVYHATNNTALGSKALYSNTTGYRNTANGYQSLSSNTTGWNNTANGTSSLSANTTGNYNTANGVSSLSANTTGNDNTANGASSLYYNTTGNDNTANGDASLYYNTTGSQNTAHGRLSLSSNSTGTGNTAIGYHANVSTGNLSNATVIGNGAIVDASNKVRIGNGAVTVIEGQVAWSFPSDGRFKYHIQYNVPGLDFITRLKPVTYYFDTKKLDNYTRTGELNNSNIHPVSYTGEQILHTGFVAQDVEKIAKELGYDFDGIHKPANDRDHYSLAYSQFIMPLIKAVQEQQQIIEKLRKQIDQSEMQQIAGKQQVEIELLKKEILLLKEKIK